jgi:2'-5' RNA ligase
MKRIFVAADISEEARRAVSLHIESLGREFPRLRVGWERAEKLHLTLKFLGETTDAQLEKLKNSVEAISRLLSAFPLEIAETGVFPNAKRARVLWIDVRDERGNLREISRRLEIECEKIGFPRENRPFRPHLTIGRLREPGSARELAEKHLKNNFDPVRFEVSAVTIYESLLQPTGSVYKVFSKHDFHA